MDARYRLVVLQFICLVWPSPPHVTVDSFVLRRRSLVDDEPPLSDAFYAGQRPDVGYLDDQYDLLPQDLPNYEVGVPDDYGDDEVADKLMNIIKQEREGPNYDDFGDRDYVNNDDESWTEPLIQDDVSDSEDISSPPKKIPLDKAQLEEIFTDTSEPPVEHDLDKKTTELSKNEVKKLFDKTSTDGEAEDDALSEELDSDAPEIDLEVPVGSSSDVDKIVKSIKEVKTDNSDAVGDRVIDVKEETISPDDGTKLTKEWMVELVQDEDDQASPLGESGSRKSKRSMNAQSEENLFAVAAKQRAVDLLKTYIELQEEENHHLTEALNLATLAQTQRTDRYIDDEVKQLRQAVADEEAIESLRDTIRSGDESVEISDEEEVNDGQAQEVENYGNDYDDVDFLPVKREDVEPPEEEDLEYDEEDTINYNKNIFLRERLRQYLLNKELESLQDQIEDVDDQWPTSKLSPPFGDVYPGSRLNPFTRQLEDVKKRYDIDDVDEEDTAYVSDPDWLKDLETAAAIAKLHDAVQVSTDYQDADVCPAVYELTDDCFVARDRRLTLDDEATQLCNRHQLCLTCGAEFGLTAETCDEGYLREADGLCSRQSVGERSLELCRGEAAGLFVIMSEEHRYAPPGATPDICRERCAYDFVVDGR